MENLILIALLLTSLLSLAFIVERGLALRRAKILPYSVLDALENCQTPEKLASLRQACDQSPSVLSNLLLVAAQHLEWPKPENEDAVQTRARQEIVRMERGLVVLEIAIGIAPLLGLVGTVFGMMTLFRGIGSAGVSDNAALATGIAVILQSTMLGLVIAIPSLIAWSYFSKRIENYAVELETACSEFLRRQYRQKSA